MKVVLDPQEIMLRLGDCFRAGEHRLDARIRSMMIRCTPCMTDEETEAARIEENSDRLIAQQLETQYYATLQHFSRDLARFIGTDPIDIRPAPDVEAIAIRTPEGATL